LTEKWPFGKKADCSLKEGDVFEERQVAAVAIGEALRLWQTEAT